MSGYQPDEFNSFSGNHQQRAPYGMLLYGILVVYVFLLSGEPDYFGRNEISSGGDLSHYSSASLY